MDTFESLLFTVQCQVLLVPLKNVNPGDIVQPAVIPDNICRGQVGAVIHLKQHFFLVIDGCRREYFLAGQVAKVRPHCPHAFKGGCGYAHFIPCMHLPQQFNFLVFQLHADTPLYGAGVFVIVFIQSHIAVQQGGGSPDGK